MATRLGNTPVNKIYGGASEVSGKKVIGFDAHQYQTTSIGAVVTHPTSKMNHYLGAPAQMLYKNGYTVFCTMSQLEKKYETTMYLYNHDNQKLTIGYSWGSYNGGDNHSVGRMVWLPDGKILMGVDIDHNDQIQFKRSLRPYDIRDYEVTWTSANPSETANIFLTLIGTRVYCNLRGDGTTPLSTNSVMWSDDFGDTWTAPLPILDLGSYPNYWAYPNMAYSESMLQLIIVRSNQITGKADYKFYLESDDGETWYNKGRTVSYDVSVTGAITSAQLIADFVIVYHSSDSVWLTGGVYFNNNVFLTMQNPTTPATIDFYYYSGGSWLTKNIAVASTTLRGDKFCGLISVAENEFYLYVLVYTTFAPSPNLNSRVMKIHTTDSFDNFTTEYVTGVSNNYNIGIGRNIDLTGIGIVTCSELKTRGGGTDTEPTNAYSDFKIIDVIN